MCSYFFIIIIIFNQCKYLYFLSWPSNSPLSLSVSPPSSDDARLFAFVRITTGDAMSKRAKFTFITWVGKNISGLQLAKISIDKAIVKDIVQV